MTNYPNDNDSTDRDQNETTVVRTANQRMIDASLLPKPKRMMGPIWHDNELLVLAGDTGLGKSVLSVQIADMISRGFPIMGLANDAGPKRTLYVDCELSDSQFYARYSFEKDSRYEFSPFFYCDNVDFSILKAVGSPESIEAEIFSLLENMITKVQAEVFILDNISYLAAETTQDTQTAMRVMRGLGSIKKKYGISILVVAHTPKIDRTIPLTVDSVAGSKQLSNFADSVIALNWSTSDKNQRYLKQLKPSRSAALEYDTENVLICQMSKEDGVLSFSALGTSSEYDHLKRSRKSGKLKDKELASIIAKDLNSGMTYAQTARKHSISIGSITKIKKLNPETFNALLVDSNESTVYAQIPKENYDGGKIIFDNRLDTLTSSDITGMYKKQTNNLSTGVNDDITSHVKPSLAIQVETTLLTEDQADQIVVSNKGVPTMENIGNDIGNSIVTGDLTPNSNG